MNPALLIKAARVIAACERMLEVCEKATPGPWEFDGNCWVTESTIPKVRVALCEPDDRTAQNLRHKTEWPEAMSNAAFIAQARTMTEPALRSTVIGLKALMAHKPEDYSYMMHPFAWTKVALAAMLDTWPDTI